MEMRFVLCEVWRYDVDGVEQDGPIRQVTDDQVAVWLQHERTFGVPWDLPTALDAIRSYYAGETIRYPAIGDGLDLQPRRVSSYDIAAFHALRQVIG
jgi:hypothetical protein